MTKYSDLDDHDLVTLLRNGNRDAFTEIYQRYFKVLFAHAYKKMQNDDAARDLIQELFTNLWVKREILTFHSSLVAYLYTAIRNHVLDHYAHENVKSRYVSSLQQFIEVETAETDHRIREKELLEAIQKEIQALPGKMREIFELSRKEHLSHKEIAEKLNISEQTVSKQITNALKLLRGKFGHTLLVIFLTHFK